MIHTSDAKRRRRSARMQTPGSLPSRTSPELGYVMLNATGPFNNIASCVLHTVSIARQAQQGAQRRHLQNAPGPFGPGVDGYLEHCSA